MKKITLVVLSLALCTKAFAFGDFLQVPSIEGHLSNLSTLPNSQIRALVEGMTFKLNLSEGAEVCTMNDSTPLALDAEGSFLSGAFIVPACLEGIQSGSKVSVEFILNPDNSSDPSDRVSVNAFDSDVTPGAYPTEFTLIEIPQLSIPIQIADGSDPKKWLEKNDSSFLIKVAPADDSTKEIQINSDEMVSAETGSLDLDHSYFSFTSNYRADQKVLVSVSVGQLGSGNILYQSKKIVTLGELTKYLRTLPVVLKN